MPTVSGFSSGGKCGERCWTEMESENRRTVYDFMNDCGSLSVHVCVCMCVFMCDSLQLLFLQSSACQNLQKQVWNQVLWKSPWYPPPEMATCFGLSVRHTTYTAHYRTHTLTRWGEQQGEQWSPNNRGNGGKGISLLRLSDCAYVCISNPVVPLRWPVVNHSHPMLAGSGLCIFTVLVINCAWRVQRAAQSFSERSQNQMWKEGRKERHAGESDRVVGEERRTNPALCLSAVLDFL